MPVTILLALLAGLSPLLPAGLPVAAAVAVPDEAGGMLVDGLTYDVALADLDGDGAREIVALVPGERGAMDARAWTEAAGGWVELGPPVEVVPAVIVPGWAGAPTELLVLADAGRDRLLLLRQPSYDEPDIGVRCCLLLDTLELVGGRLRVREMAAITDSMDAALGVDLDGDGIDELVTTRSEPPLGDISYPTVANVYRLDGDRLAGPTTSELPIGSGDTPFVLGDSDGRPGDELAILATLGRRELYRLALADGDRLTVEDAGYLGNDAVGVPLDGGRGILVVDDAGWQLRPWPALGPFGPPVAEGDATGARIVGIVAGPGPAMPIAVISQSSPLPPIVLDLADPGPLLAEPSRPPLGSSPVLAYRGSVPATSRHDASWALVDGRRWSGDALDRASPDPVGRLAGAVAIGLAGREDAALVIHHGRVLARTDGALMPPASRPGSGIGVVPGASFEEEADGGILDPPLDGATRLEDGLLAVRTGFTAEITAPPGSRIYVASVDPSALQGVVVVPPSGELTLPLARPNITTPNPRYDASLVVVTPGGATYEARWSVIALTEPPALDVDSTTPFASGSVRVFGDASRYSSVHVDGAEVPADGTGRFTVDVPAPPWPTQVVVEARDPLGNVATESVTVIGWYDYRELPWLLVGLLLVAVSAVVLVLRIPRPSAVPRRADDDGVLEELDPD